MLVVGGPVATGALSWVLFEVGVGLDRLLAIVGVALTLVIYIAQEFRPFRRRSRRIVFVGRSTSLFTRNILAGFQERTRDEFPCSLTTLLPTEMHEKEDLSFQIDCLRSETAGRADAIVIVPVRDHPSLWQELGRLAVRGVFIVVVDVKAPNRYFYQQRIRPPRFVSSDFEKGGILVASAMAQYLDKPSDLGIFLLGPSESLPGRIRSGSCLYRLVSAGHAPKLIGVELDSWDEEDAVAKVAATLDALDLKSAPGGSRRVGRPGPC